MHHLSVDELIQSILKSNCLNSLGFLFQHNHRFTVSYLPRVQKYVHIAEILIVIIEKQRQRQRQQHQQHHHCLLPMFASWLAVMLAWVLLATNMLSFYPIRSREMWQSNASTIVNRWFVLNIITILRNFRIKLFSLCTYICICQYYLIKSTRCAREPSSWSI